MDYKVGEDIHPTNTWIEHIRNKGENVEVGEVHFSKVITEEEKVEMVCFYTPVWNCEVRSKVFLETGMSGECVSHGTCMSRVLRDSVQVGELWLRMNTQKWETKTSKMVKLELIQARLTIRK